MEWAITPERVTLRVDGNWTLGKTDIVYQGFGVTNQNGVPFADNNQFGFRTPPTIRHELIELNAEVDFRLWEGGDLIVGYGYERVRHRRLATGVRRSRGSSRSGASTCSATLRAPTSGATGW